MIPYGKHSIDEDDIQAVLEVLRSDWLTTGPKVAEFENTVAKYVTARQAVAVSSGTAALHAAMFGLGIGPGDEVIVPPMTFSATANSVIFQGGTPVFVDVDADSLLLDPNLVEAKITRHTKAIVAVDYAGHPCDYGGLRTIADRNELTLIDDGCHALGSEYRGRKIGSLADLTVFSFHPVKHITTGEGGMVVTDDGHVAERLRLFRNHGITADFRKREMQESWHYDIEELGFNYRLTDIQCTLGISQFSKLGKFVNRRREIAVRYDEALGGIDGITPLAVQKDVMHAYHLYVVKLDPNRFHADRATAFRFLRNAGIGVNVHYIPVHLHPYYRKTFGTGPGLCPVAEEAYEQVISLPIFPGMTDGDVGTVIRALEGLEKKLGHVKEGGAKE